MPRVDDRMKFRCGQVIREKDGRHEYRVRAIWFDTIRAVSLDNGWQAEFRQDEVVLAGAEFPWNDWKGRAA